MKKNKDVIKTLKKSMRLKVLLLLVIMLTFNTFAWFVYSNTISNSISAYVKAWRIEFENEEEIVQEIEFKIDNLYPGMDDYHNYINIVNYGDTEANIGYEIVSAKILSNTYSQPTYSSEDLEEMLSENYPFLIEFSLSNSTLDPLDGEADFEINVTWAFESGDDEKDTEWGHASYTFNELYPDATQIIIVVKLFATQVN